MRNDGFASIFDRFNVVLRPRMRIRRRPASLLFVRTSVLVRAKGLLRGLRLPWRGKRSKTRSPFAQGNDISLIFGHRPIDTAPKRIKTIALFSAR
jgi:hypothetical protein